MQMEPLVLRQPERDVAVFVGRVVVQDHVDGNAFRYFLVDGGQEFEEFLVPVPRHAGAGDMPGQHVQCGE